MRYTPIFERIERQNEATCAMLPFVAALPWVDEEIIAKVFGQTMVIGSALPILPDVPPLLDHKTIMSHRKARRAYWREKQQESRKRRARGD